MQLKLFVAKTIQKTLKRVQTSAQVFHVLFNAVSIGILEEFFDPDRFDPHWNLGSGT